MRPRLVEYLNLTTNSHLFDWLIPDPAVVYAFMLGLGSLIFIHRCCKDSLDKYHALGLVIWGAVAGLLGGRIFYLMQHTNMVLHRPAIVLELNGATVSFGVYLGSFSGLWLYFLRYRISPYRYLDVLGSVMGIGPLIGRCACFLNGDDFGSVSDLPWAIRYPHGSFPFLLQVHQGLISPMADLSLPVHPVQLYGCLKGLLLYISFTYLWRKKPFPPGFIFCLYWICYAVFRFFLEFFRGDNDRGWVGPFSTGQFMSILFFLTGLIFLKFLYNIVSHRLSAYLPGQALHLN